MLSKKTGRMCVCYTHTHARHKQYCTCENLKFTANKYISKYVKLRKRYYD